MYNTVSCDYDFYNLKPETDEPTHKLAHWLFIREQRYDTSAVISTWSREWLIIGTGMTGQILQIRHSCIAQIFLLSKMYPTATNAPKCNIRKIDTCPFNPWMKITISCRKSTDSLGNRRATIRILLIKKDQPSSPICDYRTVNKEQIYWQAYWRRSTLIELILASLQALADHYSSATLSFFRSSMVIVCLLFTVVVSSSISFCRQVFIWLCHNAVPIIWNWLESPSFCHPRLSITLIFTGYGSTWTILISFLVLLT